MTSTPLVTTFDYKNEHDYKKALSQARPDSSGALWFRLPESLEGSLIPIKAELIEALKAAFSMGDVEKKDAIILVFQKLLQTLNTGLSDDQIHTVTSNLSKFSHPLIVPIETLSGEDNTYLLNEAYGPTDAFKDIALQMVTSMVSIIVEEQNLISIKNAQSGTTGEKLTFVVTQTSTSGDTGPAGGAGIQGKKFVMNVIGFPEEEATYSQKGQMMGLGNNIKSIPMNTSFSKIQESMLSGNTSAFQKELKAIIEKEFAAIIDKYGFEIVVDSGSFNSINPGRVDGQTLYHQYGLLQAEAWGFIGTNEGIIEVIPSGNGGHMYSVLMARLGAGYKGKTIVTCNRNNMFYQIIEKGRFQKPESNTAIDEPSVSMIIEYPNNMIRLFSYAFGSHRAKEITDIFFSGEEVIFTDDERDILKQDLMLIAIEISGVEELLTIGRTFEKTGRLICPHTANALAGLKQYRQKSGDIHSQALVSETASPWKFLAATAAGLSFRESDDIEKLYKEYKLLENSRDGALKLLDVIENQYTQFGQNFSMDLLPTDLREIYSNGYTTSAIQGPDSFNEITVKFLKDDMAPLFKKQIVELLSK